MFSLSARNKGLLTWLKVGMGQKLPRTEKISGKVSFMNQKSLVKAIFKFCTALKAMSDQV